MSREWRAGRTTRGLTAPPRRRIRLAVPIALGLVAMVLGVLGGALVWAARPHPATSNQSSGTPGPAPPAATGGSAAPPPAASTSRPTPRPVGAVAAVQTATPESADQLPAQAPTASPTEDPSVEAALQGLASDEDRVGQLLMLGWPEGPEYAREMIRLLRPGAIVQVTNADTAGAATTINAELLAMARQYGVLMPLLAVDHEGGRVQRIKDVNNVGTNWGFGLRSPPDREACERGQRHALQLRAMGFTMNLAPVLDVNNNPANPVIGDRSYGADPDLVARLGSAYIRGLQGGGIAAVGKHFPGHGNTSIDSHLSLPVLSHSLEELERVELAPFRRAIEPTTDLAAIMSAHIAFPALDPTRAPATLSQPIMRGLLRQRLGFDGLVLSDDMGVMKAITDNYTPGAAAVQALTAGVDMLIIAGPFDRQVASRDSVLAALRSGELPRARVEDAVRRVLRVKARFGMLGEAPPAVVGCE